MDLGLYPRFELGAVPEAISWFPKIHHLGRPSCQFAEVSSPWPPRRCPTARSWRRRAATRTDRYRGRVHPRFPRTQGANRPIRHEHPWVRPECPSVRL